MEFHGISDDFEGCYPMDTENMIAGIRLLSNGY